MSYVAEIIFSDDTRLKACCDLMAQAEQIITNNEGREGAMFWRISHDTKRRGVLMRRVIKSGVCAANKKAE